MTAQDFNFNQDRNFSGKGDKLNLKENLQNLYNEIVDDLYAKGFDCKFETLWTSTEGGTPNGYIQSGRLPVGSEDEVYVFLAEAAEDQEYDFTVRGRISQEEGVAVVGII